MLPRLRLPLVLLLLLALVALPACGGDDDDESTSTTAAAAPQEQATSIAAATSAQAESGSDSGTAGSPTTETIDTTETATGVASSASTDAPAGTASPEDDAAVRAAIQEYIDAFVQRDGEKACALMKPEVADAFLAAIKDRVDATDCADAFEQAAASGGDQLGELFKQAQVTGVAVEGAKATAQLSVLGTTVPILMERIDGEWKVANLPGQ
jgi:predicted lipid-binding transport protein (Tim44 family)